MPEMLDVDRENERIVKEYIEGRRSMKWSCRTACPRPAWNRSGPCAACLPGPHHIDYFPTNFILQNGVLYYVDYECNNYMDEWNLKTGASNTGPKRRHSFSMPQTSPEIERRIL